MSRSVVLCFDGTNNSVHGDRTNVGRLFECLERSDRQVVYYDPGVGTLSDPASLTATGRAVSRALDGAIGHSLRDNYGEAMEFLVRHHRPDDDLFLFGFSRGAYTARAVAAGIHAVGIIRPEHENMIPYSWSVLTNEQEQGKDDYFKTAARFNSSFSSGPTSVHFLGAWDTVSSLGWIWDFRSVPFTSTNPSIRHVRHAVAIDERRAFFRSNLYCFTGKQEAGGRRIVTPPVPGQDLKEVWFAGVHSDVGGGYPDEHGQLSKIALQWMIREATAPRDITQAGRAVRTACLYVNHDAVARCLGKTGEQSTPDALAPANRSLTPRWWIGEILPRRSWDSLSGKKRWRWPNAAKRRAVAPGSTIHVSVRDRLGDPTVGYRPVNLPPLDQLQVES
ncbi:MAG: DUF2235 domain-containing protein [Phycisphaeraceae bacterium]|nr:DUF2235 domain-containing protein [Phycisphaerae bacterium]MBX3391420.1 DUF2235 domain-containing protein [Phycisphaeraceae bacterium]